jgi:hypothetical protein
MKKIILAFVSVSAILCDRQIKQERFEFSNPVDFLYRRHYIESLSTASKLFDLGTPSGAKVTISKNNFQISAGSTLNCDYTMSDNITMSTNACTFSGSDAKSDLNTSLGRVGDYLKAKSGNFYGLLYSFANAKIAVLVHSNSYADTRQYIVSSSL